jgi:hypothetical protein
MLITLLDNYVGHPPRKTRAPGSLRLPATGSPPSPSRHHTPSLRKDMESQDIFSAIGRKFVFLDTQAANAIPNADIPARALCKYPRPASLKTSPPKPSPRIGKNIYLTTKLAKEIFLNKKMFKKIHFFWMSQEAI